MLPCHHCIALIRILVTRVKYIEIDRFARGFRFCSIFFRFSYLDDFFSKVVWFLNPKLPRKRKVHIVRYVNYLKIFVNLDLK